MENTSNFCWNCGSSLGADDVYCSNCGTMVSGKRAIKGPVSFNLTQEQWMVVAVGLFILIYVGNMMISFFLPMTTSGGFDWSMLIFLMPIVAATIFVAVLISKKYSEEGLQKWLGKKLNPYKPTSTGDRIGALIGTFFTIIFIFILIYIFMDPSIPLLTRRDIIVAAVLFLPLIMDVGVSLAKFAAGNAPEMRPVLAIKDLVSIILLGYLISNWFFNIPATITWIEGVTNVSLTTILAGIPVSFTPELIELIIQVAIRFGIAILILTFFWHLFMFLVWLDVKYNVLGGNIASVIPAEEIKAK
ncbi:MAG: zinc-ribbon domain-containing protein [Candidatus Hodarchaeales archaeon]